ncbi:hypothetical protein JCM1840_006904 [Sporobolomyces johnsonii]
MATLYSNPIPFSFFSKLVSNLSSCTAKRKRETKSAGPSRQAKYVQDWINEIKKVHARPDSPLPHGTVTLFFRLLFPEEGVRRRYGFQELKLARELEKYFGVAEGQFGRWAAPSEGSRSESTGCLGAEVALWMDRKGKGREPSGETITLGRVDELLEELASYSDYSARDVQKLRARSADRRRPTSSILYDLLSPLNSAETALVIQLILRDLSPLLYPPPSASGDIALGRYCTTAYDRIEPHMAMREWNKGMPSLYKSVADLDYVAQVTEAAMRNGTPLPRPQPQLGLPIKVPKTEKPGVCSRATKLLSGDVAVETKYDGERLQIHIDLSLPSTEQIRIFSKSGRNSTEDRRRLLPIIRASLGLSFDAHLLLASRLHPSRHSSSSSPPTKLVLEGEMVPYDESRSCIDEFWKLACAKEGRDVSHKERQNDGAGREEEESHQTGLTGKTPSPRRAKKEDPPSVHLMVVWFDVLMIEDESLLEEPYQTRRARLASLVRPIQGFSMLADSVIINFNDQSAALAQLRLRFAKIISDRSEGLMLKPLFSRYNDERLGQRWVKLKKDFIPGAGDTLDFAVVGASWQKQRGRELLVPPSVFTTFFIGLEAKELGARLGRRNKPHYHILFSTSYGLDRPQLGELCHKIREKQPQLFNPGKIKEGTFRQMLGLGGHTVYESACTSFTFSLAKHLYSSALRPTIIFPEPRVMELNGAGFQRAPGCPYYELRWPRITKPSRTNDGDPLSLSALQRVARDAMQIAPESTASQVVRVMWDWRHPNPASQGKGKSRETEEEKYERELREWVRRLERADQIPEGQSVLRDEEMLATMRRESGSRTGDRDAAGPSTSLRTDPPAEDILLRTDPPAEDLPSPLPPRTPPRRPDASLIRSATSPSNRSDAPSPSQTILRSSRPSSLLLGTEWTAPTSFASKRLSTSLKHSLPLEPLPTSKETEEEKYERELREWARRSERVDRIPEGESVLRDDGTLATTRRERIQIRGSRTDDRDAVRPSPSLRTDPPAETLPSLFAPRTSPRRPEASLLRSAPSPPAQSAAPSPSQTLLRSSRPSNLQLGTESTAPMSVASKRPSLSLKRPLSLASLRTPASAPDVLFGSTSTSATASKRRRTSYKPSFRRVSSTPSLAQTVSAVLSSPSASAPSSPAHDPFSKHCWCVYPPPRLPWSVPPIPRHPFLDESNLLGSALSVLWAAGFRSPACSTARGPGTRRQGWIFVDEANEADAVRYLEEQARAGGEDEHGGTQTVWILKRRALETRGMCDLGMGDEVLSVL